MSAVTATRRLPAPALAAGVVVPYRAVLPYSKKYVVSRSLGFTRPVSVAVLWPTLAAGPEMTSGRAGAAVAPAGTSRPSMTAAAAKPVPPWILRRLMFPFRSIESVLRLHGTRPPAQRRGRPLEVHGHEHDPGQRGGDARGLHAAHPLAGGEREADGHDGEQRAEHGHDAEVALARGGGVGERAREQQQARHGEQRQARGGGAQRRGDRQRDGHESDEQGGPAEHHRPEHAVLRGGRHAGEERPEPERRQQRPRRRRALVAGGGAAARPPGGER